MFPYRDKNGGGGILGFSQGLRHIALTFRNGHTYRYTHGSAGKDHVDMMTQLARQGSGLHGYLCTHSPKHEESR